jgi:putative restriction endonuclease
MYERSGQGPFRRALLRESEACAFTGTPVKEALEAAHIMPYRGIHTNDLDNGLLLRADVHTLFDRGLLRIDPANGQIQIDAALEASVYQDLDGKLVRNWQRLREDALKWPWANPDLLAWARREKQIRATSPKAARRP